MGEEISFAASSRPHPLETVNGDAWIVTRSAGSVRMAVIDGLGHGPSAGVAAAGALRVLQDQPELGPVEVLKACHQALKSTRGAAISVAEIGSGRLTYAGIGNVEARLVASSAVERLFNTRGIVGATIGTPRAVVVDLPEHWLLVAHSDGISQRFQLPPDVLNGIHAPRAQEIADYVLETWGRLSDDRTVVLAWPSPRPRTES